MNSLNGAAMYLGTRTRQGIVAGVFSFALLLLSAPAQAAPSPSPSAPPDVKTVTITGDSLPAPIVVNSTENADRYATVVSEVDWLANRPNVAKSPAGDKLGPKFTMVIAINGADKQTYDVYPLAAGGPRAFRPAAQPDKRKVTPAWFYGRLTMPVTLRAVGVPLGTAGPEEAGGSGGGAVESPAPDPDIEALVGDWQRFVGLNGAVVVVIGIGVFAIAFMLRRRI